MKSFFVPWISAIIFMGAVNTLAFAQELENLNDSLLADVVNETEPDSVGRPADSIVQPLTTEDESQTPTPFVPEPAPELPPISDPHDPSVVPTPGEPAVCCSLGVAECCPLLIPPGVLPDDRPIRGNTISNRRGSSELLASRSITARDRLTGLAEPEQPWCKAARVIGGGPTEQREKMYWYAVSGAMASCDVAVSNLRKLVEKNGSIKTNFSDIAPSEPQLSQYLAAIRDYRNKCLFNPSNPNSLSFPENAYFQSFAGADGARYTFGYDELALKNIYEIIGNLAGALYENTREDDPICGAALINGSVVTARHCFRTNECSDESCSLLIPDGLVFRPLSEQSDIAVPISLGTAQAAHRFSLTEPGEDWLILDADMTNVDDAFKEANASSSDLVTVGEPRERYQLYLATHNFHSNHMKKLSFQLTTDKNDITDAETNSSMPLMSVEPSCISAANGPGVFLNSCQTTVAVSGSPYFALNDIGELAFVGIHAGAATPLSSHPKFQCWNKASQETYRNYGILVPEAQRRMLSSE